MWWINYKYIVRNSIIMLLLLVFLTWCSKKINNISNNKLKIGKDNSLKDIRSLKSNIDLNKSAKWF